MSQAIEHPLPRLDESIRTRNKAVDPAEEVGRLIFEGLDKDLSMEHSASYDLKSNKLVIRGPRFRVAFQGLDIRDSAQKEHVLDILGKERPS